MSPPWSFPLVLSVLGLVSAACTPLDSASDVLRAPEGGAGLPDAGFDASGSAPDSTAPSADAQGADAGCLDPSGFSGLGCLRCPPTDLLSLENACSDVTCTPFDDQKRLTRLGADAALPALAVVPSSAEDAGAVDAASRALAQDAGALDDGSTPDAPGYPSCADLTQLGKLVYVTGSSAVAPFLAQVAQQFSARGVYIVYTATGSCVGVDAIVNGTPMTTGALPAPAEKATYWSSPSSGGEPCALPPQGVTADLGISDVFAQSCPGFELTNLADLSIRDAHGPIQTMSFVVPSNSPFKEISAQAAYFVFGFGKAGGVRDATGKIPIWDDERQILHRKPTSGTQGLLGAAIGVPSALWKGKALATSDELFASLSASQNDLTTASKTIGILGADYIDSKNLRAQVRMLAFRDTEQVCAVYPDSTETAKDRVNVRDGHYPLWGPIHLLHRVNAQQLPANPENREQVSDVLEYLSGTKALPNGIKLLDLYAQSGLVPECAMRVARSMDGGEITPNRALSPCGCLFELRATGSTRCTPCRVQGDCSGAAVCSQGYCE